MGKIILFDRGEHGGMLIGSSGVRPIPPFAAPVRAHLHAISDLLRASHGQAGKPSQELTALVTKISNLAVERIEAAIGPLDDDDSLIYLSDEDGFVCGSTGAPPRPIGWPPLAGVGVGVTELVDGGPLASDLIELLQRAPTKGIVDMLEDPVAAAKASKIKLSDRAAATLRQLAPSKVAALPDPVDRELVGFFHRVIKDGRFIETWSAEPVGAAKALGVKLSDDVVDKILGSRVVAGRLGQIANLSIEQGIVIGIIAIIILRPVGPPNIIDRSAREKF